MNKNILLGLLPLVAAIAVGIALISNDGDSPSDTNSTQSSDSSARSADAPPFLTNSFPNTDFSKTSVNFDEILTGGPGKDGIPSIDEPTFVSFQDTQTPLDVQAIVIEGNNEVRAYPYNILNWHEIVNDSFDGSSFSVTFCPLCGSAIVFDRNISTGETTFGVSGSLRESNMIMYDRETETLWQQSTGEAIVGELQGEKLDLIPFQLLTLSELQDIHPDAKILSTDTGHSRDYQRNPYAGYDENENFIFRPSTTDDRYPLKDIFIVTNVGEISVAIPNSSLSNGDEFTDTDSGITVAKNDGQITITTAQGEQIPFFFEMWFSWAVQHEDDESAVVFDPSKQ